jgi:outer membrane protein assembly factor BamB
MRKLFIGIGLLIIIGFFLIVYLAYVRPLNQKAPPLDAIGAETPVIIESNNLSSVLDQFRDKPYWDEIKETGLISKCQSQVNELRHLLDKKTDFAEFFKSSDLHLALHLTEANDFDYLYILERTSYNKLQRIDAGHYLDQQGYTYDQRTFHNTPIYDIKRDDQVLSVTQKNGLLLASFSSFLVEDAIVQLESPRSVRQDSAFQRLQQVAKSKEATKVYINCNHFNILSPLLLHPKHNHIFNKIASFSDWLELDLMANDEGILLNGYTSSADTTEELDKLKNLPPADGQLISSLPATTSFFFYYGATDYTRYAQRAKVDTTSEYYPYFSTWVGGEWAFGANERMGYDISDQSFCIARTEDATLSQKSLDEVARLSNGNPKVDSFYNMPIGHISQDSILENVLQHDYLSIPEPYYTVLDNIVLFAATKENLKTIVQRLINDKVLSKSLQYLDFRKQLSSRSNFYVYFKARNSSATLEQVLSQQLSDKISDSKAFDSFSPYAMQFSNFNDLYFTNVFIAYNPDFQQETNELWTAKLDTTVHFTPLPVKNHNNNQWEFFVQDDRNTIYLIDNTGKILWQRELERPILGEVQQLDFYNNGKLQYIFSTSGKIYLIDRLGRDVASYPLKLPSQAMTGLQLLEYEKRGVYRFFVGCQNGNIYGYERSGKPLPGWSPQEGVGTMIAPLYYHVVENNDYLVAANQSGELHYFNRAGDLRSDKPVKLDTSILVQEPYTVHLEEDNFAFTGHDTSGTVYHAYRDGSTETVDTTKHQNAFSMKARDIDADQAVEYVFLDSSRIRVYEDDFSIKFTYIFPGKVDAPVFFVPGAGRSDQIPVGVLSQKENKIYLFHANGELFQEFPLEGNTPFRVKTIRREKENVLVTSNGRGRLVAYRIIE